MNALEVFLANASKRELVAHLVVDHDDPRGNWDRFYGSWSKDALRTQVLRRDAFRKVHTS